MTEVSVDAQGAVKVHKVVCTVDTGWVINPDTIKAQMEGGIVYGLTAALKGEITIKNGRVEQRHFSDYQVMRHNEMPQIDVYIVPSTEVPGGIGEPSTALAAGSLVNAMHAATGSGSTVCRFVRSSCATRRPDSHALLFPISCGNGGGCRAATVRRGNNAHAPLFGALGPPLSDQDVRVAPRQVESVADFGCLEIHAVEDVGVLANQPYRGDLISRRRRRPSVPAVATGQASSWVCAVFQSMQGLTH